MDISKSLLSYLLYFVLMFSWLHIILNLPLNVPASFHLSLFFLSLPPFLLSSIPPSFLPLFSEKWVTSGSKFKCKTKMKNSDTINITRVLLLLISCFLCPLWLSQGLPIHHPTWSLWYTSISNSNLLLPLQLHQMALVKVTNAFPHCSLSTWPFVRNHSCWLLHGWYIWLGSHNVTHFCFLSNFFGCFFFSTSFTGLCPSF